MRSLWVVFALLCIIQTINAATCTHCFCYHHGSFQANCPVCNTDDDTQNERDKNQCVTECDNNRRADKRICHKLGRPYVQAIMYDSNCGGKARRRSLCGPAMVGQDKLPTDYVLWRPRLKGNYVCHDGRLCIHEDIKREDFHCSKDTPDNVYCFTKCALRYERRFGQTCASFNRMTVGVPTDLRCADFQWRQECGPVAGWIPLNLVLDGQFTSNLPINNPNGDNGPFLTALATAWIASPYFHKYVPLADLVGGNPAVSNTECDDTTIDHPVTIFTEHKINPNIPQSYHCILQKIHEEDIVLYYTGDFKDDPCQEFGRTSLQPNLGNNGHRGYWIIDEGTPRVSVKVYRIYCIDMINGNYDKALFRPLRTESHQKTQISNLNCGQYHPTHEEFPVRSQKLLQQQEEEEEQNMPQEEVENKKVILSGYNPSEQGYVLWAKQEYDNDYGFDDGYDEYYPHYHESDGSLFTTYLIMLATTTIGIGMCACCLCVIIGVVILSGFIYRYRSKNNVNSFENINNNCII